MNRIEPPAGATHINYITFLYYMKSDVVSPPRGAALVYKVYSDGSLKWQRSRHTNKELDNPLRFEKIEPAAITREQELEKALEHETNIRKNLQHVIVSQWGVDAITNCIKQIREAEEGIGPLGPINDYALAKILSSTLQLPAELIIADLKEKLVSEIVAAETLREGLRQIKISASDKKDLKQQVLFAVADTHHKLADTLVALLGGESVLPAPQEQPAAKLSIKDPITNPNTERLDPS